MRKQILRGMMGWIGGWIHRVGLALCLVLTLQSVGQELLPPGHKPSGTDYHALVGARIHVAPGEVVESGTLVIRHGRIVRVGPSAAPPAGARIWDLTGKTVYAGLIDPYWTPNGGDKRVGGGDDEDERNRFGHADQALTSRGIRFFGVPGEERDPGSSGPGHELAAIRPEHRVAASLSLSEDAIRPMRELGFTAAVAVPERGILRGASALVLLGDLDPNQALLDADVFQHAAFDTDAAPAGAYPQSLMGTVAAMRQAFFDANHYRLDHADHAARPTERPRAEFHPSMAALQAAAEGSTRVVWDAGSVLMVHRAAHLARELGIRSIIVASGHEWRRPDLIRAIDLPFIVPLTEPNLPDLPDESDWDAVSLDALRQWDWSPENPALLRRMNREIALTTHGIADRKSFRKLLRRAILRGLSEIDALAALTTIPAAYCERESQLGTIAPGKLANLTIVDGPTYFDPKYNVSEVWVQGVRHPLRTRDKKEGPTSPTEPTDKGALPRVARSPLEGRGVLDAPPAVLIRGATVWTCGPAGRLKTADVLVVGGQIRAVGSAADEKWDWPAGTRVIEGRGRHVTPGLVDAHSHSMIVGGVNESTLPSTAMVRIGDVVNSETAHIYKQLAGGLTVANLLHGSANPIGGQNAVIKLRDGAGPDGLMFEAAPAGIKFALGENVKQSNWGDEKVTRFPQTRMGVPTFIANRFHAATHYRDQWRRYREAQSDPGAMPPPLPPRRDLELEALVEILEGERWIHCHSYRQDEILVFLRLMERFGVQVGTLQHVLEGYKIADEIARHGAGASCFSDWWAYKFEVLDAIPYAGSLMRDRGVLVSFNSDSSDLARRLNLEAAKAVKYGGTSEVDALDFVTINPARQLRIDHRVGSLEPGKDADFVIWSGSPLSTGTTCLQTWIEGKKYFDRALDPARTAELKKERSALIDKAKKRAGEGKDADAGSGSGSGSGTPAWDGAPDRGPSFFRLPLELKNEGQRIDCGDCGENHH